MNETLILVWAGLLGFAVLAYVILDGFDLGVGILFPFAPGGAGDRDIMMNSVAPVWDGNETWLILGGGGLFAVFPLAYATILPALYAPLIAMLLALVFRGVAFEFRWRSRRHKYLWSAAFAGGSILAAFAQGDPEQAPARYAAAEVPSPACTWPSFQLGRPQVVSARTLASTSSSLMSAIASTFSRTVSPPKTFVIWKDLWMPISAVLMTISEVRRPVV